MSEARSKGMRYSKEGKMSSAILRVSVLALAVFLAGFGCGKQESTGSGGGATVPGGKATTAAEKAPAGAITVKVGSVLPKSGDSANFGDQTEKGILLAVQDAKAEGKVWPEIIVVDDAAEQAKTMTAVTKLMDVDKVSVIVGPVTTNCAIAAGDRVEAGRVPLVTPTATNAQVTLNRKYVFRVCFTDDFQGKAAANFAFDTLGKRNAAILTDSGETYSTGLGEVFATAFRQRGGQIASHLTFTKGTDDFGGQVTQFKLKKPDVIFLPTYYEAAAKCVAQARAAGLRTVFVGTDGWDSPDLYKLSGGAVKGNFFTTHFSPLEDRAVVKKFVQNFRAAYNDDPTALAALGYDAAMVVFDAVKRAGSADRQAITNAIEATKDFEGVTGKFSIDDKHNAVKSLVILETGEKSPAMKTVVNP